VSTSCVQAATRQSHNRPHTHRSNRQLHIVQSCDDFSSQRVYSDLPIRPSQTQPWLCICKCSGMLGNVQGRRWRASPTHSCYLMLSLTPDRPRHVAAFSVRDLETRPFNCQHLRIRLSSVCAV